MGPGRKGRGLRQSKIRSTTGVRGRDLRLIPPAPHAWPLTGHLVPLARDPLAFLKSLPAHGALVRVHMGPVPLVVMQYLSERALNHLRFLSCGP